MPPGMFPGGIFYGVMIHAQSDASRFDIGPCPLYFRNTQSVAQNHIAAAGESKRQRSGERRSWQGLMR